MADIATDAGSNGAAAGAPADQSTDQSQSPFDQANDIADQASPPPIDPGFGDDIADQGDAGDTIELVVNGETITKTLDEVKSLARQYIASEQKLEQVKKQAADIKSQQAVIAKEKGAIKQLLEVFQKGDFDTMAEFAETIKAGAQFKQGAIQFAMKLYEHSRLSPEQREHIESKRELEKMRQAHAHREKQDSDRAFEYQVGQWTQHIQVELPKAFKELGVPDTAFVREHAIATWKDAVERGQQPTALAVVAHVKARMEEARLLHAPTPTATSRQRPRATPQSVGKANGKDAGGHINFTEWQKSRGR